MMRPRVNPRLAGTVIAGSYQSPQDEGDFEPIKGDLKAMTETGGWDRVTANLRVRMARLQERMATDTRMPEDQWRKLQHEWAIYERIVKDPLGFFTES